MSKVMLVNVTHVEESRVAILEDGVLAQYEIETINRTAIKGNIHNAVVDNVHPSLEAAFLKLSGDLKGFLPLDEVNFKLLPARTENRARGKIGQHLHPGQKLMVQVIREPFAGKPPTVTTYFSLPGRYLVLMPGVDSAGVSRKIEDASQREQLRKLVEELNPPEGFGVIVRTAGVGQSKVELQRDLRYLLRLWESIQRASRSAEFPGLVYRERDLVIRTIRDYFTPDIGEVWIDSPETHQKALEFVKDVMPGKEKIVKLYPGDRPLFSKFNLEDQIESIYKRRVPLKAGGEIVIDGTEALTAIDVNSARSNRQGDAEENALSTNLEAVAEIARQLRLRDLGGLVVVDFIDMMATRNQRKVEKTMRDAMKADRAKYDVTRISKLGLMEIARQRIRAEKLGASYTTCSACEGFGLVKNVESAALAALRKLQARCLRGDFGRLRMALPPEVSGWLLNNKREDLVQLERRSNIRIAVESKFALRRHESEFETFPREKVEEPPALVVGDRPAPPLPPDLKEMGETVAAPSAPEAPTPVPPVAATGSAPALAEPPAAPGSGRKRRRRRRRHARAPEAAGAPEPIVAGAAPARSDAVESGALDLAEPIETALSGGEVDDSLDEQDDEEEEAAASSGDGRVPVAMASEGAAAAPTPVEGAEGQGGGRRRRRRRRRRRGRGTAAIAEGQGGPQGNGDPSASVAVPVSPGSRAEASGSRDGEEDASVVPRHIRSEELMPAATGGVRRGKGAHGMRPTRPRHRRHRGPIPGASSGSNGSLPDGSGAVGESILPPPRSRFPGESGE